MAQIYQSVAITETSASSAPVFEKTFNVVDWQLDGSDYKISVPAFEHNLGINLIIQVEELNGSFYQEVTTSIDNSNGNITIKVGNTSRFTGRVLIKA